MTASTDNAMLRMKPTSVVPTRQHRSGREPDPSAEEDHTDPERDRERTGQLRRTRRGLSLIPLEYVAVGAEMEHQHVHTRQEHAQKLELKLQVVEVDMCL